MTRLKISLSLVAGLALVALAGLDSHAAPYGTMEGGSSATATLQSPDAKVSGTVHFTQEAHGVHVVADVAGAKPGEHGFHLHENGVCTPPDYKSAGGHWNPGHASHACSPTEPRHEGDLGNITVGSDGKGHLDVVLAGASISGTNPVVGKAVVLHADPDDCKTQPTGNAGGRLACGVVAAGMAH